MIPPGIVPGNKAVDFFFEFLRVFIDLQQDLFLDGPVIPFDLSVGLQSTASTASSFTAIAISKLTT